VVILNKLANSLCLFLAGWKVLLTSRNESVAMRRNTSYINFKPECLTTEDSWTLFQRIALPMKDAAGTFNASLAC